MNAETILDPIRKQLPGKTLAPAPEYPGDPHAGLMVLHRDAAKYALDDNGQLTGLNLAGCGLDDAGWQSLLRALGEHAAGLRALNLAGNQLSRFDFTPELARLEQLNLSRNQQLTQLVFSAPPRRLEKCFLRETGLTELALPAGLDRLQWLDLRGSQLQRIAFDGPLPALEWLELSGNQLAELPLKNGQSLQKPDDLEAIAPRLRELYLQKNPLPEVLRGFLENQSGNCLDIVQRHLRELKKGAEADNECKLLLIGNGFVGKTCFVERLVRNRFLDKWGSTHAIFIEEQYPYEDWLLNIWDFGGQDIYHATHRLFMQANSVYLLFWDAESEEKKYSPPLDESGEVRHYENFTLDYWLDYARTRGRDKVPAIVVQTKTGRDGKKDRPDIRERYTDHFRLLEFEHIESKEPDFKKNGYRDLLNAIDNAVSTIKPPGAALPANYAAIRRQLRDLRLAGDNYLDLDDYLDRASKLDIESPMDVLKTWLTGTGVVFYREGLFQNKIILDQAWAIRTIYTIFDRNARYYELLGKKGRFSGKDLERYWPDTPSGAERELFLSFMLSCEMCFETTPEGRHGNVPFAARTFIAPQLLPEDKPGSVAAVERVWAKNETMLYLRYSHQFLHYGIIQSFIVRTQSLAKVDDIWKNGILLEEAGQDALIESEQKEIRVLAPLASARLFQKIRKLLRELQETEALESVSYDGKGYVALETLKNWPRQNPVILGENGEELEFARFEPFLYLDEKTGLQEDGVGEEHKFKIAHSMAQQPNLSSKPRIFISYAHKDEAYKDKLVEHLSSLKNQGLIEAWNDRQIEAGMWDTQIKAAMEAADVFLLLITPKFLASRYISEIEIKTAYQKFKLGKAKIFPVICDDCKWDIQPVTDVEKEFHPVLKREMYIWLGKFQPFPKDGKSIKKWRNKNEAYTSIIDSLIKELVTG